MSHCSTVVLLRKTLVTGHTQIFQDNTDPISSQTKVTYLVFGIVRVKGGVSVNCC